MGMKGHTESLCHVDGNEGTYGVPRIVRAMWDSGMGKKGHRGVPRTVCAMWTGMKGHTESPCHVGQWDGNEGTY